MRRDFRAYLLGTVCMAASIVSAQAGGLVEPMGNGFKDGGYTPMGGSLKDSPMLAPARSRWYIRGDVGYTRYGNVGGYIGEHQEFVGANIVNIGRSVLAEVNNDDTWMIGGGVGYNLDTNWRSDITFDYHFRSRVDAVDKFLDSFGTTALASTHSSQLSSFVTLANLYYDFGDRNGFSPYVGAGLGFAINRLSDRTITCELASGANAGQDCGGGTTIGAGDSNLSVAAAAMVGFSRAMTPNMKLDVGYRFLYMGDAKTANDLAAADGGSQGQLVLEDITAHELRVGLRYEFGGR